MPERPKRRGEDRTVVQTTVRLPLELQNSLRQVATRSGESVEETVRRAVRREVARNDVTGISPTTLKGQDLLAYRFALFAPTPIVVKIKALVPAEGGSGRRAVGQIIWANLAYQHEFGLSLPALLGKSLGDLGFVSWERHSIETGIAEIFETRTATWRVEPVIIHGRGKVPYFTHRFVFDALEPLQTFLGDVSFDWTRMIPEPQAVPEDLLERAYQAPWPTGLEGIFGPLLHFCRTSIAVKDRGGKLVLHNEQFRELVRTVRGPAEAEKDLLGRTSPEIFGLNPAHPMVQNEAMVLRSNVSMYTYDTLDIEKLGHRVSLRFPIPDDDGVPEFVGTMSTDVEARAHQDIIPLCTATV